MAWEPAVRLEALQGSTRCTSSEWSKLLDEAKIECDKYIPSVLRASGNVKPQSYGEIKSNLCGLLIDQLNIGPRDSLVDIGSGVGTLAMHFASQGGARATGLEIRRDLHGVSRALADNVQERLRSGGYSCGALTFLNGDVRRSHSSGQQWFQELIQVLENATVVVINNVVFPPALDMEIFFLLKDHLKAGTRVVCFKEVFPRLRKAPNSTVDHPISNMYYPPYVYVSQADTCSWTYSPIKYQVYTVINPMPEAAVEYMCNKKHMDEEESAEGQEALEAWVRESDALAWAAVDQSLVESRASSAPAAPLAPVGSKKARKRAAPKKQQRRVSSRRKPTAPLKAHYVYIEEKAFFLPPSPPRVSRGKHSKASESETYRDVQLESHGTRSAVVRERTRSTSPLRTRNQRRKAGQQLVELKKDAIWRPSCQAASVDDFCGVCFSEQPEALVQCSGECYRAFHLGCGELKQEGAEYFCGSCSDYMNNSTWDTVCADCLESTAGGDTVECNGACLRVWHQECASSMQQQQRWMCPACWRADAPARKRSRRAMVDVRPMDTDQEEQEAEEECVYLCVLPECRQLPGDPHCFRFEEVSFWGSEDRGAASQHLMEVHQAAPSQLVAVRTLSSK